MDLETDVEAEVEEGEVDSEVTELGVQAVVWETPSRPRIVPGIWLERLAPLVANPGRWGRVMTLEGVETAERHASNLRKGKVQVPEGVWEFTSRSDRGLGESYLYARFGGGKALKELVPVDEVELIEGTP